MALLDSAIEDVDLAMTNYVLAALARDENVLPGERSDRGRSGVSRCLKRIEQGCSATARAAVARLGAMGVLDASFLAASSGRELRQSVGCRRTQGIEGLGI